MIAQPELSKKSATSHVCECGAPHSSKIQTFLVSSDSEPTAGTNNRDLAIEENVIVEK